MRDPDDTLWWRIINLQPATWRGLVIAIVAFLGALGVTISDDIPDSFLLLVAAVLPLIQALWTKGAVTPNAKVAIRIDDPVSGTDEIEAGPAQVSSSLDPTEILFKASKEGV